MSARLIAAIESEVTACADMAAGFRMSGDLELAARARTARTLLTGALVALVRLEAAIGEAREREREA